MTSPWQRTQDIFAEAIETQAADRLALIRAKCGDDDDLYQEVATLIEAFETTDELEVSPIDLGITDSCDSLPSDTIPGYEIHAEIHRGGQGVVYRATQLGTKRDVAIKFLLSGPLASKSARQRFQREVVLASQLRHPGIVPIFDSGIAQGQPYYVMEYVDGRELHDFVTEEKRSDEQIVELIAEIGEAVGSAHRRGIIHRDLKPSNVLVTQESEIRVLDFGLAKPTTSPDDASMLSMTGQIMGTLHYMSPEQADGRQSNIGPFTDVYSLCVILYELLAGRLPHSLSGSMAENLMAIQRTDPPPLNHLNKNVSPELSSIIGKGLSKEPERRYANASKLASDLRRCLAGESVEAKPDSLPYAIRKKLRQNFLQASVAAALIGGIAIGVYVANLGVGPPPVRPALAALVDGQLYSQADLESQLDAMRDLIRQNTEPRKLLNEFHSRFETLTAKDFTGLSKQRQSDLNGLLETQAFLGAPPAADSIQQKLNEFQSRESLHENGLSGLAQEINENVLQAALSITKVKS